MTFIDEKVEELENIKSTVDLSHKRARKNQQVLQDICDDVLDAPLASEYFSKKVANYLAHSSFDNFSKVYSDEGIYYISDFGDELSFKKDKGIDFITYRTNDDQKSFKLYVLDNRAYVVTVDESKREKGVALSTERVYDISEEPKFKRERKCFCSKTKDGSTIVLDLLEYKNNNLLKEIVSTTRMGDAQSEFKYSKLVDPSRYEMRDGELYLISEDDSKVIEKSNDEILRLLRF